MNKFFTAISMTGFFLVLATPLFAQNCNPNVPIDGGISALLAAGAGYGIKKVYDKRKAG